MNKERFIGIEGHIKSTAQLLNVFNRACQKMPAARKTIASFPANVYYTSHLLQILGKGDALRFDAVDW